MTEVPAQPDQVDDGSTPVQPEVAPTARTPRPNLPELSAHPSTWELLPHVERLSRMVAHTEFVPASIRNRPNAVAGAMLLGHELGLGPMAALRGLVVTEDGGIMLLAQTMRAVVRRAGHRIWPGEHTSTRCTWHGMRADDPDHEYEVTWTIDDARQAKLIVKGSAWLTTPRAMLSARASSELCRILAEDALAGVPYSAEEVEDQARVVVPGSSHPDEPDLSGPEPAPGTQRRSRRSTAAAAPSERSTAAPEEQPSPPGSEAAESHPFLEARPPADDQVPHPRGPDLSLPVPGDDEPELPIAPAAVAAPALPPAQMLAMACREANLDRGLVCLAVSGGRTDSARELTTVQATLALDRVRAVARGEAQLLVDPEGFPFFERVPRE